MSTPKPIIPADKPTRNTVECLLHELITDFTYSRHESKVEEDPVYVEALAAIEARKEELEKDSKLVKLRTKLKQTKQRIIDRYKLQTAEARKVFRVYQAKGLTPDVCKLVEELVQKVNKL